jgi:hypothetical protein
MQLKQGISPTIIMDCKHIRITLIIAYDGHHRL